MIQITENFFKDPYSVRNKALSLFKSDFYTADNWPGKRVVVPDDIKSQILFNVESIVNEKLTLEEATFQAIDKSCMKGISHVDGTKYTCITFLNLKAPSNTGTEVYSERHGNLWGEKVGGDGKARVIDAGDVLDEVESFKRKFYQSNRTFIDRLNFKKNLNKVNSMFKDPCVIPNKFNRSVVFDSPLVHRAQNFCGNDINNSRLTVVSFFGSI